MKTVFLTFFIFFLSSLHARPLTINVVGWLNGKGTEADLLILEEAISHFGHTVNKLSFDEEKITPADINIFVESIPTDKLSWAKINWLIPNPEWFVQEKKLLKKIDLVLCRTRQSDSIFRSLGRPTYYLGFTSIDCFIPDIKKDYSHLLHLAGSSHLKGTKALQIIWQANASLPLLTIVRFPSKYVSHQSNLHWITYKLPVDELRLYQNQCGIHLCPSESEGFGHYIMEAMSAGAIVITTDAPPMNELIRDSRCLVPYFRSDPLKLGFRFYVDGAQLQDMLLKLSQLPPKELDAIGASNRKFYLMKKQHFYEKLNALLSKFSHDD